MTTFLRISCGIVGTIAVASGIFGIFAKFHYNISWEQHGVMLIGLSVAAIWLGGFMSWSSIKEDMW